MKINILNLKYSDERLKGLLGVGLFLYILSAFILIVILNFRFIYDVNNLLYIYGIYFFFNFIGLLLILSGTSNIIDEYKQELIKLNAYKLIIDTDKSNLFKKIKWLEQVNKKLKNENKNKN